jgi:hypothetical protein
LARARQANQFVHWLQRWKRNPGSNVKFIKTVSTNKIHIIESDGIAPSASPKRMRCSQLGVNATNQASKTAEYVSKN